MSTELKTTRLSVGTILLVVFVLVSSGPYGVEEMVSATGPGAAILLLVLIPVVWGAPLALICTELASAMPDEGGAYVWVERALGRFWAFQSGWWSTLSGLVDTALYVVLAVSYVDAWLGGSRLGAWLLSVGIIAAFALVNVVSLRAMALSTVGFAILVLAPCAVLTALGFARWDQNPLTPLLAPDRPVVTSLGMGLTVAIWFYSGYESMSTMAGEVAEPRRVIPKALLLAIPAVTAVYLVPTVAALASVGRWSEWSSDGGLTLVDVAGLLGGPALAAAMLVGALVSNLALYNAYLASCARTTLVMAERHLLPGAFAVVHPRHGTPYGSILITAAIHAALALLSFEALLVIDVFLFVMSYLLIFVSVVVLRLREPAMSRPFRIPFGTTGVAALAGSATIVGGLLLVANGTGILVAGLAAASTGVVAYPLIERRS